MNRVSKWRISRAAERITARLPAPKGANYSITASKRSAPADGCYCLYTAPRESNEPGGWKLRMGRPRRGRANSSLGWSTAEPEVWWMERMSASKRSLCPLRQVACTPLRGYPRGVRAFRGFRCAPPAATDRSAPLGRSCGGGMAREAGCPPRRDAIHRVSHRPDGLGGAAFLPPLLKPLFFNTENRLFSRARAFARKYAKIRNV